MAMRSSARTPVMSGCSAFSGRSSSGSAPLSAIITITVTRATKATAATQGMTRRNVRTLKRGCLDMDTFPVPLVGTLAKLFLQLLERQLILP
jgi:hypothetical protein